MNHFISEPAAGGVVARSSGWDVYYVYNFSQNRRNGGWECECDLNRQLRKKCHHISAVAKSVKSDKLEANVISFWGQLD